MRKIKSRIFVILMLILSVMAVQIYQPVLFMEFEQNVEAQSDAEIAARLEDLLTEEVLSEGEHIDPEEERKIELYSLAMQGLALPLMGQRALDPYVIENDGDPTDRYVMTTFSELQNKITELAALNNAYTLTLNQDLIVTGDASLTFPGPSTWTVAGNDNTVKKEEGSAVNFNRVIKIGEAGSSSTVTLKNVVIDGSNTYRACDIQKDSTLTLDTGAIIQNGYSASDDISAGVHMGIDTRLNMKPNSKISGNISEIGSYHGGAIKMSRNCVVDIDGAVISDNSARFNGGAIYVDRAATSLTIKNTTFSANKADTGGAIHTAVSTEIEKCIFENNESIANGGAIYTNLNAAGTNSLLISDTTFSENKAGSLGAQREGGAIYSMVNTKVEGGAFENNTTTREGGAIFTPPSSTGTKDLLINGTTFSKNEAKDGGAIYSSAKMTISNASFQENKANKDGGGIYAYKSEAVKIDNTTFKKNRALGTATPGTRGDGGAIYAHKDTKSLSITETNFSENTSKYGGGAVSSCTATVIEGGKFENNSAGSSGGAIAMSSNYKLEINNAIFSGNRAANNGGAVCVDRAQSLSITKTNFSENTATLQGGAIHSKADTSIQGGEFERNIAKSGGAFHTASYSVSLDISPHVNADNTTEKTSFSENTAEYGGAIYSSAKTTINKATFQKNIASIDGGCIYAFENAIVKIDGTIFQENTANNNGGAIFANKNATSLTIEDTNGSTSFSQNMADKSGGAVFSNVATSIEGGRFEKNTAGINGGAINLTNNRGASLTAEKTIFTQNKAARGGAIFTQNDTTIKNSTSFNKNEVSAEGGAIYTDSYGYADPAASSGYAKLKIDSTTSFKDNKASYPYEPPSNFASFTDLLFSRTTFTNQKNPHSGEAILLNDFLLNNYDINYKNSIDSTLCLVSYFFKDADAGSLPQEVLDLLPANSQAGIGSIVIPASSTSTSVEFVNGAWTFQGWDKAQVNIQQEGVAFIGTWRWVAKEYTVKFDTQGGSTIVDRTVKHGETVTKPADPTKADYDFADWYADSAFNNAFDFTAPITADTTVYARWTTTPTETTPTPNQTTTAPTTEKVELLVKTGETSGQTLLFGCLSILGAVILLLIRKCFKRDGRRVS